MMGTSPGKDNHAEPRTRPMFDPPTYRSLRRTVSIGARGGLISLLFLLHGCAVPVPPTGGPPDQDPPTLVSTNPADGTVNFSADRISFQFDERLDERSIAQALSITPEFDSPPLVSLHGDRVDVVFPGPLRPNTTYIISLDTRLRDAHNVALTQPLSVAFGTGPSINEGKIRGMVVENTRGRPARSADIFAYSIPDSSDVDPFATPPDYRTQSDDQGRFILGNLSEQSYYVIALRDRNTNRRLDPTESAAVPPVALIRADSAGYEAPAPWVLALVDSDSPEVRRIRSLSNSEIELRFSEPVILGDTVSTGWVLRDSLAATIRRVNSIYAGADQRDLVIRTDSLPDRVHSLTGFASVTDSSGNRMVMDTLHFTPSGRSFTPTPAFTEFLPADLIPEQNTLFTLWPGIDPGFQMTEPMGETWRTRITVTDTSGVALPFSLSTENGIRFYLQDVNHADPFVLSILESDTTHTRTFIRADDNLLGELSGIVLSPVDGAHILVELIRDEVRAGRTNTTIAESTGAFRFKNLPGGARYRLRYFLDMDENEKWFPGEITPYQPAEPIGWIDVEEPIRARWETVVPDTLSFGGH